MGAIARLLMSLGVKAGPKTTRVLTQAGPSGGAKALARGGKTSAQHGVDFGKIAQQRVGKINPGVLQTLKTKGPRAAATQTLLAMKNNPLQATLLLAEMYMIGDYFIDAFIEEVEALPEPAKTLAKQAGAKALEMVENVIADEYPVIIDASYTEVTDDNQIHLPNTDGAVQELGLHNVIDASTIPHSVYVEVKEKIELVVRNVCVGRPHVLKAFLELIHMDGDLFKAVFDKEFLQKRG